MNPITKHIIAKASAALEYIDDIVVDEGPEAAIELLKRRLTEVTDELTLTIRDLEGMISGELRAV